MRFFLPRPERRTDKYDNMDQSKEPWGSGKINTFQIFIQTVSTQQKCHPQSLLHFTLGDGLLPCKANTIRLNYIPCKDHNFCFWKLHWSERSACPSSIPLGGHYFCYFSLFIILDYSFIYFSRCYFSPISVCPRGLIFSMDS